MLVACGSDDQRSDQRLSDADFFGTPATSTTLSIGNQLKQDLDEIVQDLGGYDDYDDFRQDADRFEAEMKAWFVCIETHDDPSVVNCPPPEG